MKLFNRIGKKPPRIGAEQHLPPAHTGNPVRLNADFSAAIRQVNRIPGNFLPAQPPPDPAVQPPSCLNRNAVGRRFRRQIALKQVIRRQILFAKPFKQGCQFLFRIVDAAQQNRLRQNLKPRAADFSQSGDGLLRQFIGTVDMNRKPDPVRIQRPQKRGSDSLRGDRRNPGANPEAERPHFTETAQQFRQTAVGKRQRIAAGKKNFLDSKTAFQAGARLSDVGLRRFTGGAKAVLAETVAASGGALRCWLSAITPDPDSDEPKTASVKSVPRPTDLPYRKEKVFFHPPMAKIAALKPANLSDQ